MGGASHSSPMLLVGVVSVAAVLATHSSAMPSQLCRCRHPGLKGQEDFGVWMERQSLLGALRQTDSSSCRQKGAKVAGAPS